MPLLLSNQTAVWFPLATRKGLDTQVNGWLKKAHAFATVPSARKFRMTYAAYRTKCGCLSASMK